MATIRVYFDTCVWCRPFDELNDEILKDVKDIEIILEMHDRKMIEIISSSTVLAEADLIDDALKKMSVIEFVKSVSDQIVEVDDDTINLAERIRAECGLKWMDALHVAVASKHADVFITVDRGILKKSECLKKYIIVQSPTTFNEYYGRGIR